jgi:hypothetical protein
VPVRLLVWWSSMRRLLADATRCSLATRRFSIAVIVLLGLLALGLAWSVQVAVPIAIYPFA